jgi:hypothetical protein
VKITQNGHGLLESGIYLLYDAGSKMGKSGALELRHFSPSTANLKANWQGIPCLSDGKMFAVSAPIGSSETPVRHRSLVAPRISSQVANRPQGETLAGGSDGRPKRRYSYRLKVNQSVSVRTIFL